MKAAAAPQQRTIVIYHAGCVDGFTAAWAAWRLYLYSDRAEYVPASYGEPPPDVAGADVLVVDFSYPRAVLEAMHASARSLRVFDHHKTAQADLDGLPYATFDMDRSGAGLTWDILHDGSPRPWVIDYVEDRDLWRFALLRSHEVNAFIGAQSRSSFESWEELLNTSFATVVAGGKAIGHSIDRYVEETGVQSALFVVQEAVVPVINASYVYVSELVGMLARDRPFAVGWYQDGKGAFRYSLRSRGDVDVSAIAKSYGGGGHAKAAGFSSGDPPWVLWARAPGVTS